MKTQFFAALGMGAALLAGGCAATDGTMAGLTAQPGAEAAPARSAAQFEADRQAILAMAGEYDVTFDFREVIAIQPGYEFADDKRTGAWEVVRVIEDRGDFISLQHLLLTGQEDGSMVIKHWRQDWRYEPDRLLAFEGHDDFAMVEVAETDAVGAWSQTVYQVDDSPRYGGLARWTHENGVSTWEPEESLRPLPRRDDTTRTDYDAIEAVNRHIVTEWGWVHEQDNTKLVLAEDGSVTPLVREVGVNTYRRTDLPNDADADAYWDATADYWAMVRDYWNTLEATQDAFHVEDDAEGTLLYGPMLDASMRIQFGMAETEEAWAEARTLLERQVTVE